jgi:hypothetical protein
MSQRRCNIIISAEGSRAISSWQASCGQIACSSIQQYVVASMPHGIAA